jgi:hypothetical protein
MKEQSRLGASNTEKLLKIKQNKQQTLNLKINQSQSNSERKLQTSNLGNNQRQSKSINNQRQSNSGNTNVETNSGNTNVGEKKNNRLKNIYSSNSQLKNDNNDTKIILILFENIFSSLRILIDGLNESLLKTNTNNKVNYFYKSKLTKERKESILYLFSNLNLLFNRLDNKKSLSEEQLKKRLNNLAETSRLITLMLNPNTDNLNNNLKLKNFFETIILEQLKKEDLYINRLINFIKKKIYNNNLKTLRKTRINNNNSTLETN